MNLTDRQIELIAQKEAQALPGFTPEKLIELQNNLMADLYDAEKRARSSRGRSPAVQQLARESQEFAIARAEEFFALDMEAF